MTADILKKKPDPRVVGLGEFGHVPDNRTASRKNLGIPTLRRHPVLQVIPIRYIMDSFILHNFF